MMNRTASAKNVGSRLASMLAANSWPWPTRMSLRGRRMPGYALFQRVKRPDASETLTKMNRDRCSMSESPLPDDDDMTAEYDFSSRVHVKYLLPHPTFI